MNDAELLGLGLALGFRHALDVDHVVVMLGLIRRGERLSSTMRIAGLWSLGHTAMLGCLGVLLVLTGLSLPPSLARAAELIVALLLVVIGVLHVRGTHDDDRGRGRRSFVVGTAHGAAGSGGIALVTVAAIPSQETAWVYLGLFAFGTVVGMTVVTGVLFVPLRWLAAHPGRVNVWTTRVTAVMSIGLGVYLGALALGGD